MSLKIRESFTSFRLFSRTLIMEIISPTENRWQITRWRRWERWLMFAAASKEKWWTTGKVRWMIFLKKTSFHQIKLPQTFITTSDRIFCVRGKTVCVVGLTRKWLRCRNMWPRCTHQESTWSTNAATIQLVAVRATRHASLSNPGSWSCGFTLDS